MGFSRLGMKKVLAGDYTGQMYLQRLLEDSGVFWVLILCFALTVLLCASFGLSRGSRSEYTLRRLSVSESTLHLWQAGFALVCFLLLYLFQIPLGYGMAHWYAREMGGIAPDMVGEQTVFLIFWESKLFHFLLPLHDGTRWLSSLASTVALSLGASYFAFCRRQRKVPIVASILLFLFGVNANRPFREPGADLLYTAVFLILSVYMVHIITRGGWRIEEEA